MVYDQCILHMVSLIDACLGIANWKLICEVKGSIEEIEKVVIIGSPH